MQSAARVVALAFLAALAGCESMSNPAQQTPDPGNRTAAVESVPGQYIVVLQDNVADPATVARDLVSSAGGAPLTAEPQRTQQDPGRAPTASAGRGPAQTHTPNNAAVRRGTT